MSYRVIHSPKAETHWTKHIKSGDKATMKKIVRLLEELEKHSRSGTGKPEHLKYKEMETWSRRINDKHRMVYEIDDDIVTIDVLSFWGHYGDK
jgi:toxin YoeB